MAVLIPDVTIICSVKNLNIATDYAVIMIEHKPAPTCCEPLETYVTQFRESAGGGLRVLELHREVRPERELLQRAHQVP